MSRDYFDKPYEPQDNVAVEFRQLNATEHAAHHLGRISEYLRRIAEALEKKPPQV